MDSEFVKAWLEKTLRTARVWNLVAMVGSLLGGLLVLYVSFWVSYGVVWFISHSFFFPLTHRVILCIAGGFMTLVVIVGAKQNLESLGVVEKQVRLAEEMDIKLTPDTRYGMSYDTNAVKAGAFEIRSMASAINYVLYGGVLLVLGSLGKLRQFQRLKRIDVDGCARVITLLLTVTGRQSFTQIVEKLPGLNPVRVFDDLHYIDGVLFLSGEPAGLTLRSDLRSELCPQRA